MTGGPKDKEKPTGVGKGETNKVGGVKDFKQERVVSGAQLLMTKNEDKGPAIGLH